MLDNANCGWDRVGNEDLRIQEARYSHSIPNCRAAAPGRVLADSPPATIPVSCKGPLQYTDMECP